jgi:hypothetical protein
VQEVFDQEETDPFDTNSLSRDEIDPFINLALKLLGETEEKQFMDWVKIN